MPLELQYCWQDVSVTDCCAEILVDVERLESSRAFKPEHLGYIIRIFEDTSDSRFRLWDIQKYKEVTEFINKVHVCDMDVIPQEYLITYKSLVQEATQEYLNIVDSKRWEPATIKEKSQDQPSLPKSYNVAIDQSINKDLEQVDFKICHGENGSGSGRGSYARSDITCHKCGKKGHIQKDCKSKGNGSGENSPKNSTNELPYWVNKKPVVSDTKYLTTANMTHNNKKYKWCTSCNNVQGARGFHWKDGHEEWKIKHGKNPYVSFSNSCTNSLIYCSYIMTTSEESMEEEPKGGDDSQSNKFISLSTFELIK